MSRVCQITGKSAMGGNSVSHSKRRVKRKFNVNLFRKKFYLPNENRWVHLIVSASGLRTINKKGIVAAINDAKVNGIIDKI
jgi:large subunit ribosomal protein L28